MTKAWLVAGVLLGCADPGSEVRSEQAAIYYGARETGEPWVVAVSYLRPGTTRIRLCTGSVIAPGAVLTAKHCVFDEVGDGVWEPLAPSALTVTVTSDFRAAADAERGVAAVWTTPGDYTRAGAMAGDDIAVLTLDGDLGVTPVPHARLAPAAGAEVHILGFGFTELDELGVKYGATATIAEVGAGVFETTGEAWTCTGDSGGPALDLASGTLAGVTSYGPSTCATPASFYTRVDRHAAMIDEALGVVAPAPPADGGVLPSVDGGSAMGPPDAGAPDDPPRMTAGRRDGGGCSTLPPTPSAAHPAGLGVLLAFLFFARALTRKVPS